MRYFLGSAAIAALLMTHSLNAGTVEISDGSFSESDWSIRFDGTTISRLDPSPGIQFPIGGNPGQFREITLAGFNTNGQFSNFQRILAWHFFEADSYDPSSQGAILSIDYSEDSINLNSPAQTGFLALRQDGLLFRSKESYTIESSGWEETLLPSLVPEDFELFFNGNFVPTGNPDFSESGSEIHFGVARALAVNSNGLPRSRSGLDNFSLALTTAAIPEPTCLALLLMAAGPGILFRLRDVS